MTKKLYRRKITSRHLTICVEGYLRSFATKKAQKANMLVYQTLLMARNQGYKVILFKDTECPRFSYETGCPGHIKAILPNKEDMIAIENEYLKYMNNHGK